MQLTKPGIKNPVMWYQAIGALYVVSGLWCAINPQLSAAFLGISFENPLGTAEFFTVYGGLQTGIGLAIVLCSLHKPYLEAAAFFSAVFSTSLLCFRLWALAYLSQHLVMIGLAAVETLIVVILWRLWFLIRLSRKNMTQV